MSRQVVLPYMYWLTICHIGNFRDVPLIEVSVEIGSIIKHCRKKRRPIIFTVNAQEKKAEGRTLIKILWQPKEGKTFFKLHTSRHQPTTPSEPPWITRACSRHVTASSNIRTYRLDVMHAGDTNQTTSTQTLLSPNALALAPTTTTKLTFISPANEPPNLYTQNHATSNKPSCTLNLPHPSPPTSPPSLHRTIKRKFGSHKHEITSRQRIKDNQAWNLIRKARNGPKKYDISSISRTKIVQQNH